MEPENQNAPATPETAAAETATATATAAKSDRGRQQVKQAKVVSNKMDKTVVVTVEIAITHRLYHRYLKRTSRFHAHDERNECNVGDVVEIVSSRPLSRTKRWRVRRIIKKAE
jgi:small subunit ribosomal protein S17